MVSKGVRVFGILLSSILLFAQLGQADVENGTFAYYGAQFYQDLKQGHDDGDLVSTLHHILDSKHVRRTGQYDEIVGSCGSSQGGTCYSQKSLSYEDARKVLLGKIDLEREGEGNYYIHDVYCQKDYYRDDFRNGPFPGPGLIPSSVTINIEHTWPQSRFGNAYPKDMQKTDMHHLFPSDSQMNSIRGNFKFAEVDQTTRPVPCPIAKFGVTRGSNEQFFEPPAEHRGHVARALFYFAVRYNMKIEAQEEKFLRKWHREFPVDADERARHEQIAQIQAVRNPFIDHPELVDRISEF